MKQYSKRDFLDLFPERQPSKRIPYHDIRDDGVYLRMPDEFEVRVGLTEIPVEHPTGEPGKPALPFPFTVLQFLDFERTAGLVAEMSDDEVRALPERNPQSYELACAARADEARRLLAMPASPLAVLLEEHWEKKLDTLPKMARVRLQAEPVLRAIWDTLSAEERKAEAVKRDHHTDFDERREEEYGEEQAFAEAAEQRGEPVDHEALRRRAIDKAIERMGEHPLVVWSLPDDRRHLPVSDALNITAAAIHPAAIGSDSLADAMHLQVTRDEQLRILEEAVRVRAVTILNSTSLTPMPPLSGEALERASIARDELQHFARIHLRIALSVPEWFEKHQQRRVAGRYTLEEAANEIAQKAGERADVMLGKLMRAAQAGALPMYEPGRNACYSYGEGGAMRVREDYEEAHASDLNKWLEEHERRIVFRFAESKPEPADQLRGEAFITGAALTLLPLEKIEPIERLGPSTLRDGQDADVAERVDSLVKALDRSDSVGESSSDAQDVADGKKWTQERIEEARQMRDRFKGEGKSDYTKRTADHYDVSSTFLRKVLGDAKATQGKTARAGSASFWLVPKPVKSKKP